MRKCWQELTGASRELNRKKYEKDQIRRDVAGSFLYKGNPALDAGFHERYAFDQKSSNR